MAICYYIGLDTLSVFNTGIAKACAISSTNSTFKTLLKYTGLPSLEEMANQDAFVLIRQWQILNPEYFIKGSDRIQEKRKKDKKIIWSGVQPEFKDTCLEEWMKMARTHECKYDYLKPKNPGEKAKKLPLPEFLKHCNINGFRAIIRYIC